MWMLKTNPVNKEITGNKRNERIFDMFRKNIPLYWQYVSQPCGYVRLYQLPRILKLPKY
jgi:hypothetical protein